MTISVATKNQLTIVQELANAIWPDTYGTILSQEQLDYMMDLMYSLESLENQYENNKIFLLVNDENGFIGFASYEMNFENSNKTKIHKLYILPQIQGKGIGKNLIHYIEDIAKANSNSGLILNVNKYNKAKDFYLNCGFEITKSIIVDIGKGYIMDDYVMEKKT